MQTRRDFVQQAAFTAGALAVAGSSSSFAQQSTQAVATHATSVLPPLGYAPDALEPFIDAQTMSLHHDKHHKAYVDNLTKALANEPKLAALPVESLVAQLDTVPEGIRTAVRNQGGGHANHSLFWPSLKKNNGAAPKAALGAAFDKGFGSYSAFQTAFTKAALGVFGSGWAWVVTGHDGALKIVQTANQDSPLMQGMQPLFGIDVWEHAYYLKYQNRRPEYVAAFYNVIDWDFVTERYQALLKA